MYTVSWDPNMEVCLFYYVYLLACEQTRSTDDRALRIFIHVLNNDSLLNVFYFCRPAAISGNEANNSHTLESHGGEWGHEHWWYKPAQVCRRWRGLILTPASHLGLNLHCTYGVPVAVMLAH